jgi:MFS transporter, DHA3 family, macrolide efflux protein
MLRRIISLLSSQQWFALLSFAYLLTTIGGGLTNVLVYGELSAKGTNPLSMSLAFVFSVLPTIVALQAGEQLLRRFHAFSVLAAAEIVGAIGVCLPFLAIKLDLPLLLIFSTTVPALCVGAGVPAYGLLVKQAFKDEDFATISAIESITLAAHVLLGAGVGTLLFPFVSREIFLAVDFGTYVIAGGIILISAAFTPKTFGRTESSTLHNLRLTKLAAQQRRCNIYTLVPIVAAIIAPALALLPAAGSRLSSTMILGSPVNATLLLLFARGLSQIVGPIVFSHKLIDTLYANKARMAIFAIAFLSLYAIAFTVTNVSIVFIAVLLAQVFGFALSATAQAGLFKQIEETDIVKVSSRTYQVQILATSLAGLLAGAIANFHGVFIAMIVVSLAVIVAVMPWFINRNNQIGIS